ncbi:MULTISPECIES: hypothetical protein [Klebsiella pneumoniae complex]|uniref:hypothetical protein n=1 Tax=Klebsiella pneumoniae complex TaxID=3390273 RepID=UPI0027302966|nr:hypothetical protein [Klebsiella variicola]MDP1292112.1 hypothetical protein [Klebsiella variicola]MDP1339065.1 hypothetical protein [Klebsiella variicola]
MSDLNDIHKIVIEVLVKELYRDLKSSIPSLFKKISLPVINAGAKRFQNPESLLEGLKTGSVKNNEMVVLECKPTTFGPYLRSHYLMPCIGSSSDMRLGPVFLSGNQEFDFIYSMFAQVTSHLAPVGLYPPIDNDVSQITLYPSDAHCYGFIGSVPGVNNIITSITAITSQDKISFCGAPSHVKGIVRQVTQAMFIDKGLPIEIYEELRQSGDIWYLDVYSEGTEIKPMHDGVVTEMWGGLYASGHIEMEGELLAEPLINGVMDAFKNAGYNPEFVQNMASTRDLYIYARGMRFSIKPDTCFYSLHMDAELAMGYKKSRNIFNNVCDNLHDVIIESAKKSNVNLLNPRDLDFTYTDTAKSFSILESKGAGEIKDPVAIVVRDWFRRKNSS